MTTGPLSAAVVLSDRTLREETFACIDHLPVRVVTDLRSLDEVEELLDRIERFRVDVVLLESGLLKIPLDDFARRLRLTVSDPVLFVMHGEAVAQSILEAMQAGAREYICPPLATPLREAFGRLSAVRAEQVTSQQRKLGRIFGFLSAKGGCGATTFASHVATMAARRQTPGKPLLLADLDFEAGLLRFILKAKPRYSVRDALDNMHRMDSSYWNALVTPRGAGLEFIAAPEELADRSLADPRQLARLLRFIRSVYPIAVLDFGRCASAGALESVPEMETLFLIVTQDLMALDNAKEFIRQADERGKGRDRIKVILNRVARRQKPDLDGLESYLGVRPAGVFSDDSEALYEVWSEGRMLSGASELGRQLAELAASLRAQAADESGTDTKRAQPKPGTAATSVASSVDAPAASE